MGSLFEAIETVGMRELKLVKANGKLVEVSASTISHRMGCSCPSCKQKGKNAGMSSVEGNGIRGKKVHKAGCMCAKCTRMGTAKGAFKVKAKKK